MKLQALFSSKNKSRQIKVCLLQFLFGALRVNKEFSCQCVGPCKGVFVRIMERVGEEEVENGIHVPPVPETKT